MSPNGEKNMQKYNAAKDLKMIAAGIASMAANGTYGRDMTYEPPRAEFVIGALTLRCIDNPEAIQKLIRRYNKQHGTVKPAVSKAFAWVSKAIAVKDTRECLNYVYVTPEYLIGCNGHVLHRAPNAENMAPGYYDKKGNLVPDTAELKYPDIGRIVPETCDCDPVDVDSLIYSDLYSQSTGDIRTAAYTRADGETLTVNRKYLDNALVGCPEPWILAKRLGNLLRIDSKTTGNLAVIMGLRMDGR
jgi:hypothetical protein